MDRRGALQIAAVALAAPGELFAQRAKRVYRIATLDDSVESARDHLWRDFRNRLRELVLADGNDVAYEFRYARGNSNALPALAAELVALKPDLIVTNPTTSALAMMKATTTIPVVFVSAGDPVGAGLVKSLARPGGNMTGTSNLAPDIVGKLLEFMRELFPSAKRLAYLTDTSNKGSVLVYRHLEARAQQEKLSMALFDGRQRAELDRSFAAMKQDGIQGLIVGQTGVLLEHREQIVQLAMREKLPALYGRREFVEVGGLLSFNADINSQYRQSAEIAHRILNGAKPAELPVQQSSRTHLAINLKAAKAYGIKFPDSMRVRANEVIE